MIAPYYKKKISLVALKIATIFGAWAALGFAVVRCDSLVSKIALWMALGFVVNGMIQLWHDSWHATLFKKRWQNHAFGNFASFLLGTMYEPARHGHMLHHKYNRTKLDPDAYNVGPRSFSLSWRYYNIIFLGLILSPLHFNFIYPLKYFSRGKLARHALALFAYGAGYVFIASGSRRFGIGSEILQAWIVPVLFASPWNGMKSVADHYADDWNGSKYRTATTVRSNAFVTFFWNGLNYHLEHHLYPQIPGYQLPHVHRILTHSLEHEKSAIFGSYTHVFWKALLRGPQIIDEETNFNSLRRRVESA